MGDELVWKRKGQPEKRGKQQIEAVGADEIRPEVGVPVPKEVPAPDRLVREPVKRDLLDVEIAEEDEISPVVNQKRHEEQRGDEERQCKCAKIVSFCGFFGNHTFTSLELTRLGGPTASYMIPCPQSGHGIIGHQKAVAARRRAVAHKAYNQL